MTPTEGWGGPRCAAGDRLALGVEKPGPSVGAELGHIFDFVGRRGGAGPRCGRDPLIPRGPLHEEVLTLLELGDLREKCVVGGVLVALIIVLC